MATAQARPPSCAAGGCSDGSAEHGSAAGERPSVCTVASSDSGSGQPRRRGKPAEVRDPQEMRKYLQSRGSTEAVPAAVMCDLERMKAEVRRNLAKETYDVKALYHREGFWQMVAKHPIFENFTLCVIAANAIWMSVDTDWNDAPMLLDAHPVFQVAEHAFCFYFSGEWFARFMAFEVKRNGLRDGWFVFDSILVSMMVVETWVVTIVILASGSGGSSPGLPAPVIFRLFRLLRLSRMARMLRSMPELLILVRGMRAAMRSVGSVMLACFILMYVFAIAFTQMTFDTESGSIYFGTIPNSMYTLMVVGTFLDNLTMMVNDIARDNVVVAALFFLFVLLAALTKMNMLIGVLCEVVSAVAATEKEEMRINDVHHRMKIVVQSIDDNQDNKISRIEFAKIMDKKDAVQALMEVGVDPMNLLDFTDQIFEKEDSDDDDESEKELTFDKFMDVVLQFRGSNSTTVKDMVDFRKWLATQVETQIKRYSEGRVRSKRTSTCSMTSRASLEGKPPGNPVVVAPVPLHLGAGAAGAGPPAPLCSPTRLSSPRCSMLSEQVGRLEAVITSLVAQAEALGTSRTQQTGEVRREVRRASDFSRVALAEVHHVRQHLTLERPPGPTSEVPFKQLRVLVSRVENLLLFEARDELQKLGRGAAAEEGSRHASAEAVTQRLREVLSELEAIRDVL